MEKTGILVQKSKLGVVCSLKIQRPVTVSQHPNFPDWAPRVIFGREDKVHLKAVTSDWRTFGDQSGAQSWLAVRRKTETENCTAEPFWMWNNICHSCIWHLWDLDVWSAMEAMNQTNFRMIGSQQLVIIALCPRESGDSSLFWTMANIDRGLRFWPFIMKQSTGNRHQLSGFSRVLGQEIWVHGSQWLCLAHIPEWGSDPAMVQVLQHRQSRQ